MAPPNVKIKHLIRSSSGNSRFPKLDECAHFHYENVELGPIKVILCDKQMESTKMPAFSSSNKENEVDKFCFLVLVVSNGRKWMVRRTYNDFVFLDTQLHRCVYDRKYSLLRELPNITQESLDNDDAEERIRSMLTEYLQRFSQLAGSLITCGPVLNWLELDNRGNRLIVTDEVAINTPAVAAAYVIMQYTALAADEISFDVGDMISVIDMPPPDESTWWRGKRGFEVGFFPSECVEVIGDKVPREFKLAGTSTKPVFRKHGKLIAFFRSFLLSRPSRRKLKQSGILKERVFGCDLAEHLLNTGREIPLVLKCCSEFIEKYGVVDGIYRLSGVSSNIQRLRNAFDEDCATNLGDPNITQDIHSVASLLKMYFRELPNPLLTYQLYDKFVSAVQSSEDVRLLRIRDVVQQLPPPHYRTLQYLLSHLARVASHGEQTGMTPKNIAIVWAPNLLRSRDVENGGVGALHVVGVQAVLTEYLIRYCDLIFDEKVPAFSNADQEEATALRARPKSLAISTPTKLLSLEEARARALSAHLPLTQQKYIDVGGGPDKLPSKYHTVIDLPAGKQGVPKLKKSPSGWKSFFSRGWYSGSTRDKMRPSFRSSRKASTGSLPHTSAQLQEKLSSSCEPPYQRKKLRTVKSAESLIHCSKESSPINTDERKQIGSRCSSPEASMESSFMFESGSAVSKSPSLQKHTRSSSHESYFDNSMDMLSDPAVEEEEHSLFYYMNEQMQKMQQQCSNMSWQKSPESNFDSPDSAGSRKHRRDSIDSCEGVSSQQDDVSMRKQKMDSTDGVAQAKVQRLSWMEDETVHFFRKREECVRPDLSHRSSFPVLKQDEKSDGEESKNTQLQRNSVVSGDTSFWLPRSDQSVFCKLLGNHEDGYQLDPYAFYDCSVDKWASCMSSSDNETECGAKTVVERYGNAETVLVEVHATQDSSSEGELGSPTVPHSLEFTEVSEEVQKSVDSSRECDVSSEVHGTVPKQEIVKGVNEGICTTSSEVSHFTNACGAEREHDPENITCESKPPSDGGDELISVSDDKQKERDEVIYQGREDNLEFCESPIHDTESAVNDESLVSTNASCDSITKIEAADVANNDQLHRTSVRLKPPSDLSELNAIAKQQHEGPGSKSKSPPSPVYPVSLQKVPADNAYSVLTRIDSVPSPKKHQALSIPSPSSPVEEVRRKFEPQSSVCDKSQETAVSGGRRVLSQTKSVPSKLSLKQKELFESRTSSGDGIDASKRRSEGVTESKGHLTKRHSEPLSARVSLPLTEVKTKDCKKPDTPAASVLRPAEQQLANTKPKSSGPSLFTQLKVRKLQCLKGNATTSPAQAIDPWSDPILDMQEDYYPTVSYPEFTKVTSFASEEPVEEICAGDVGSGSQVGGHPMEEEESRGVTGERAHLPGDSKQISQHKPSEGFRRELDDSLLQEEPHGSKKEEDTPKSFAATRQQFEENSDGDKAVGSRHAESYESDTIKRERINRIKEERRAQLREKLKTESFRLEAEEKEKVQSKFRTRKDVCRHSMDVSSGSKDVEKPVERDPDARVRAGEKIEPSERSIKSCGCHGTCECNQKVDSSREHFHEPGVSVKQRREMFPVQGSSSEPSSTAFRRSSGPGDIKERVAIFERSKDSKESCRLGPNGKFSQKQVTPALTPSYVR